MTGDILSGREAPGLSQSLQSAGGAAHTNIVREPAGWERLLREVNAYDATVDDCTNDLCSRNYLAHAMALANTHVRDVLADRVPPTWKAPAHCHGRRGGFWHTGQKWVPRPPKAILRTGVPHTRHDSPVRP